MIVRSLRALGTVALARTGHSVADLSIFPILVRAKIETADVWYLLG